MKQRYIKMRKSNEIDAIFFYDYYNSKYKLNMPFHVFNLVFYNYMKLYADDVLNKLDIEFNLTIVTYNNKVIDAY